VSRIIRVIVIAGLSLLVLITTCSPPQQSHLTVLAVPLPARQVADDGRPTAAPPKAEPALASSPRSTTAPRPTAAAAPTPAIAPTPTAIQPTSLLGRSIDRYLTELVDAKLFQGVVLVARDGQVLISKGYGFADAGRGIPNTTRTRFRLASLTKQFTAMAIMILQSRGKLDVQDSVCTYIDDCPDAWRPIMIHNLLTHTSGLPNYTDFASYDLTQAQPTTPAELVARFRDLPLLFAPGTDYVYGNSDYVLLGLIIERASGQSYADFMHDAIFEPLRMRDTGVDHNAGTIVGAAIGYRTVGEPAPFLDTSTLFSAGALYSTVEDMYRWDQALYTTKLVPKPLLNAMWTPFSHDYGYGWRISNVAGHRKIHHPGLMDGFANAIARYPDDNVTIIVLSNISGADPVGISDYLATLIFDS
jgi:CubicO group peptidase (beta-lactamase class C family)